MYRMQKYDPTAPGLKPMERADYAGWEIVYIVDDLDEDGVYDVSLVVAVIKQTIEAALLDAAPAWRNVSDGLPEIFEFRRSKPCWVFGEGHVIQARWHQDHGWIEAEDKIVPYPVSHWQYVPVPKPPSARA